MSFLPFERGRKTTKSIEWGSSLSPPLGELPEDTSSVFTTLDGLQREYTVTYLVTELVEALVR